MANTAKTVRIDAWFNTDNHIFFKNLIASFGNPGRFVVSQPKSMSRPMQPLFFVSLHLSGEELIHALI